jgi:hypothetical protein
MNHEMQEMFASPVDNFWFTINSSVGLYRIFMLPHKFELSLNVPIKLNKQTVKLNNGFQLINI